LVNLAESEPSPTLGELLVVDRQPDLGLATVSFASYSVERRGRYVVKALPVVTAPVSAPQQALHVQLVGFSEGGFVLQMSQPSARAFALGRCMVEVSEILTETSAVTLEEAIQLYYRLVQQQRYAEAWPMLAPEFREAEQWANLDTYRADWQQSGPAILASMGACYADNSRATYVLELHYPDQQTWLQQRCRFVRDWHRGHPRFGYWLFLESSSAEPDEPFAGVWNRLTEDERVRLGSACSSTIRAKFALQPFERGLMYWFAEPGSSRNIWVLYGAAPDLKRGSAWQRYVDGWEPTGDPFSCQSARENGDLGPVRGFGWVWCTEQSVQERVGLPTSIERGTGDDAPDSFLQYFQGGALFFRPNRGDPLNDREQIFVLLRGSSWRRFDLPF
jgi:hypothetical protein